MARQWSATPSTAVRICSIPLKGLLEIASLFFIYLSILKNDMRIRKILLGLLFVLNSILSFGQCDVDLHFMNISHVDCYGDATGSIEGIILINTDASIWWEGPNSYSSNSLDISGISSGEYSLIIMNNLVPQDTSTTLICTDTVRVFVEQTIKLTASIKRYNMCHEGDSVDFITTIWGGTPPYNTLWSNGDTSRNANNLPPTSLVPHTLTITDTNFCVVDTSIFVDEVSEMNPFMSSVGVICKDDNSGEARVFAQEGTPPYSFNWGFGIEPMIHDSFSEITGLFPGFYAVEITDDMGCIIYDSIEVKSNPNICLTIYKAFSPNDDNTHEFWEIENIHLYPTALVTVYDRNGTQVFRRRNYVNAEEYGFGGKDKNGQPLPSGNYYYVIDLEMEDEIFKGTVTIVR